MRQTTQRYILCVITFLSFSIFSFGQQTHIVTLHVDTENLNIENVASDTISSFMAENTQIEKAFPPEEFTIIVSQGSTIVWEATSSSSTIDKVEILRIVREGGPNIFSSEEISKNEEGKVQGVIINKTFNEPFKYKVLFQVNGTGPIYQIDPKIKVGS